MDTYYINLYATTFFILKRKLKVAIRFLLEKDPSEENYVKNSVI